MLIGRVQTPSGEIVHVRADGERLVQIEDPYAAFAAGRPPVDVASAVDGELLAASAPLVVVGIAQNGPEHESPVQAWLKSPRTVVVSGQTVTLRRDAGQTVAEGEIAVVIGRDTTGLTDANAASYILGLTAVNDLSSPDRMVFDPRNFEGKTGEGYTPLAAWIDTEASLDTVTLTLSLDGEQVAATDATALPMSIAQCLAYVARWTTLGPGDVIMTGAPHSQSPVQSGQRIDVTVGAVRLSTPTR